MKSRKFRLVVVAIILVFLITLLIQYLSKSRDELRFVKSVSTLRQVHIWTVEYKNITLKEPSNLKELVKYFTKNNLTEEYKILLTSLEEGTLDYKSNPEIGEPMIRWKKQNLTIKLMPNGNISAIKN